MCLSKILNNCTAKNEQSNQAWFRTTLRYDSACLHTNVVGCIGWCSCRGQSTLNSSAYFIACHILAPRCFAAKTSVSADLLRENNIVSVKKKKLKKIYVNARGR